MVEEEFVPMAKALMDKATAKGVSLFLPEDVIVADAFKADANAQTVSRSDIPDGWMGLDIGPATLAKFKSELSVCKTVVWNGPMGVFEFEKFSKGAVLPPSLPPLCSSQHVLSSPIYFIPHYQYPQGPLGSPISWPM
jgi:3-phosphoglycerate kinase